MQFSSSINGIRELELTFNNIPRQSRRVYMTALRAGGTVVRKNAEKNLKAVATAGYATGTAEKNIRVYSLRKYRGNYRVGVQIRRGAVNRKKIVNGSPVRIGLYASVLEYGKKNQPPRSWIRKAIRESNHDVYVEVAREFRIGMVQAIQNSRVRI